MAAEAHPDPMPSFSELVAKLRADLRATTPETRMLQLEMRAGFVELHNDLQDLRRSLGTVIDDLSDFRRQYKEDTRSGDD